MVPLRFFLVYFILFLLDQICKPIFLGIGFHVIFIFCPLYIYFFVGEDKWRGVITTSTTAPRPT